MSDQLGTFDDLTAFLRTNGWKADSPGARGALWRREASGVAIAVPEGVTSENDAWRDVIGRVALSLQRSAEAVDEAVRFFYVDVQTLRAETDGGESIPLEAGYNLFATGRALVRTAAATSRSLKSQIGGSYGAKAISIADRARFGQTRVGSYVVPLFMPLGRPSSDDVAVLELTENPDSPHAFIEPEERLVTKTMAQAVTAIRNLVVEPAKDPQKAVVTDLVAAGVSREMVVAIMSLVSSNGVSGLEVKFDWAPAFDAPPTTFRPVEIPGESAELLEKTASFMRSEKRNQGEVLSGPIVHLADDDATGVRFATIRTIRRGRQTRVEVQLDEPTIEKAHTWFKEHRDISVSGVVKSAPGQAVRIESPSQFQPIDDLLLIRNDEA